MILGNLTVLGNLPTRAPTITGFLTHQSFENQGHSRARGKPLTCGKALTPVAGHEAARA